MKKEILMLAVLMMSAACTEISVPDKVNPEGYRTLYFTSEKPVSGDETKTYYNNGDILWGPGEEKIAVVLSNSAVTVEDKISGTVPQRVWEHAYLYSEAATISEDKKTATFALTENETCPFPTSSGKYRFHAIYPTDALFTSENVSIWEWGVYVGTRGPKRPGQYPSATSYDPNMDVMLGISQNEYSSFPATGDALMTQTIPMIFDRLVTHVKIHLTDISNTMTNITKAIITGPKGCTMSGIYYINVLKKDLGSSPSTGETKAGYNYVILNYGSSDPKVPSGVEISGNTFDLWFCTQPIEIAAGQPLTISLYNEKGCLSRQITAREGGIKFEKNKLSTLTVSMASGEYSTYTYELLNSNKETVTQLELPRTSGVTEFYVRTNAGNDIYFKSSLSNIVSIYPELETTYIDDKGWNVIKCYAVHKENHSISNKIEGTITINIAKYGSYEYIPYDLKILQSAGEGDVVKGDWTGDYVEMAGLLWYPCNLGFDLDHPFGKYYQWGRKDGQYAYCDNTSTKFAVAQFDEESGKFSGTVDNSTIYQASGNWFKNDKDVATFNWPEDNQSAAYDGMGNPCPENWRLPTINEWKALAELFSDDNYTYWKQLSLKDNLHGIASFTGKTSGNKAAVWELWDDKTGVSLEFCVSGYLPIYDTVTEGLFQKYGEEDLGRYKCNAFGSYWASDISTDSDENKAYFYMYFDSDKLTQDGTITKYLIRPTLKSDSSGHACGYSVRCVQDIAAE